MDCNLVCKLFLDSQKEIQKAGDALLRGDSKTSIEHTTQAILWLVQAVTEQVSISASKAVPDIPTLVEREARRKMALILFTALDRPDTPDRLRAIADKLQSECPLDEILRSAR
jgi:hypothetical protein